MPFYMKILLSIISVLYVFDGYIGYLLEISPFISRILIGVILILMTIKGRLKIDITGISILLMICLVSIVGLLYTPIQNSIPELLWIILIYMVSYLRLNKVMNSQIFKGIYLALVVAMLGSVIQLVGFDLLPGYSEDVIRVGSVESFRSSGFFAEPSYLGMFSLTMLSIGVAYQRRNIIGISSVLVLLSGSLGAIGILLLVSFVSFRKILKKKSLIYFVMVPLILFICIEYFDAIMAIISYIMSGSLRPTGELALGVLHSLPQRLGMFYSIFDSFLQNPVSIIIGNGPGHMEAYPIELFDRQFFVRSAPNAILQYSYAIGVPLTLWIYYVLFGPMLKNRQLKLAAYILILISLTKPLDPIMLFAIICLRGLLTHSAISPPAGTSPICRANPGHGQRHIHDEQGIVAA
jgi:hypothetical protein